MRKLVKGLVSFSLIGSMLLIGLSGCNSENNEKGIEVKTDTPENVSESFVEALISSDFDSAVTCAGLNYKDYFVSADSIKEGLQKSKFADISKVSLKDYSLSSEKVKEDENGYICEVKAVSNKDDADVKAVKVNVIPAGKQWVVNADDFYNTNFTFQTAGNVKVSVDDKEVPFELCSNMTVGDSGKEYFYTLPYVSKGDIKVEISCDNYTYSQVLKTSSNNKDKERVVKTLSVEEQSVSSKYIMSAWNDLYNDFIKNKNNISEDCISKHLLSDNKDVLESRLEADFNKLVSKGINFEFKNCKPSNGKEYEWVSDTEVICYFDYELTWDVGKESNSMGKQSSIVLSKTEDGYKISEVVDDYMFSDCNKLTHEW